MEQLSPFELIIGFLIISSLYLFSPPNLILEIYAKMASEIEGAKSLILKKLRHMALAEAPEAVNKPVREFIDSLELSK